EEVRIAGQLRKLVGRAAVAGVGERRPAVGDAEPVRLDPVVRNLERGHLEPRRLERRPLLVLVQLEGVLEHLRAAEGRLEPLEQLASVRRQPELRPRPVAVEAEHRAPDPRDDVAPVVEVEVRDRDRVHLRPRLALAQTGEDSGPAVEEEPPAILDEVPRLRTAWIGPSGRAADDRQPHRYIFSYARISHAA